MLGICSTIEKSHMKRNVFKHGYWAASRGLQSQGATTISILFPTKTMIYVLTTSLSFESAFCNIFDVQKGNASLEHIFNPCWGSAVLLRSHIWRGMFLNMATELPPGGLQSQEVGSHNDIHTVSDHWSHLYQALSLESALCKILDVQKGNASFEHMLNPGWGSAVLLGSHLWLGLLLNMATELPPGGLQSQEVGSHNDIHTVSEHWSHLYQTLSLESALCKILDVQKGNASFEHIFNPRWGSVVFLGSHLWIGVFLNVATELPPGDCKAKEPQLYPYCFRPKPWCIFWPILFHQRAPFVTFSVFRKGMHHLNICSIHVGDL